MKQKFKMTAKQPNETTTTITVEFVASKHVLTKGEQQRQKAQLQNAIHQVLRDRGYDIAEINLVRR